MKIAIVFTMVTLLTEASVTYQRLKNEPYTKHRPFRKWKNKSEQFISLSGLIDNINSAVAKSKAKPASRYQPQNKLPKVKTEIAATAPYKLQNKYDNCFFGFCG